MKIRHKKIIKNAEARAIPFTVVVMLIATALTGIFLISPISPPTVCGAVTTDFSNHKLITVDHTLCEGAHTNLVIWVHNISSDFADNCQADGDDIAFFSQDNNTQYKHDIEVWNSGTGEIGAWVNITDEIDNTTDFVFYIYYNDPDGVDQRDMDGTWDAKYSAVYHMNTSGSPLFDSSGNAHTLAENDVQLYQEDGVMDYATLSCDHYWSTATHTDLNMSAGEFTILMWLKPNATHSGSINFIGKGDGAGTTHKYNGYISATGYLIFTVNDGGASDECIGVTTNLSDASWHQIVLTRDNDITAGHDWLTSYINGTPEKATDGGDIGDVDKENDDFVLGDRAGGANTNMEGYMDECWVIKGVAMNNSWINTTFNNQKDTDAFFTFGEQDEPPSDWGNWSDTWTISSGHTCTATGYEYGNWSFSEHINASTLDEAWTEANDSHWYTADNSSWWDGNHTYCANTTGVNSSFAVLDNSGLNRTQGFGWVHLNDTDDGYLYPYIIFAYNGSVDFDCVMWDPFAGGNIWMLNWNGTNMTDVATNNSVVYPSTDAENVKNANWEYGDYLTLEGNYYKYIYNELAGTIRFKYWSGGAFNEPDGWGCEYQHANLTHDTYRCQGIGFWNPYDRSAIMEWDLMNIWQLNYTTNASDWCNISDYNESRPHMDFPVINMSAWTDEMVSYFNDTFDGNMTADLVRSMMKDNNTNLMNLESRGFEMKTVESNDQNDTIYYYACLIDEWQTYNPEAEYDEYLHIHIQMCPEDEIDVGESADIAVAIDVDNNHVWDANDRIFHTYSTGTYALTEAEYNGNGDPVVPATHGSNIWKSDQNAIGNLHRYNSHLNYVINIPLASLIKTDDAPLSVSDVFGLSIMTSMSGGSTAMSLPAIWQNWNETSEAPYWDEDSNFASAQTYFHNGSGESEAGEGLPNSTFINRWGEGIITDTGGTYNESGDIEYNMTVEASFDNTSSNSSESYKHVNVSINVTNDGAGSLTDIYINVSWWDCSCSDLNMTFVSSNQDISNWTWFNDSCYAVIHNPALEPLTVGNTWEVWYNVNITNCSGIDSATDYLNISVNASELDENVTISGDDAPVFNWGRAVTRVCVGYTTDIVDVIDIGITVFNVLGILMIISAILMILGVVYFNKHK